MKRLWLSFPLILAMALAACTSGGPVRRISEPAASIQQLQVDANGNWNVELRLQNYSSIPVRFDSVQLELQSSGDTAALLHDAPGLVIGPESPDVITLSITPNAHGRLLVAHALADGRSFNYILSGRISATPTDRSRAQNYDVRHNGTLSPVPGRTGVLR